ncbi:MULTISPECIES: GNAT family N-acetyltransferase [Rhizobium]|uniref:GNAT family N-acetyltransferase n=1 Tax=Rhizobium TaxID=379 RepID=UPI00114641B9|nr:MULTISPECIES: GNAT family N-acetyltransferase [Rhizobium]UFS80111.1 GNAT family N-acetyltransferase [Rhizobium sp. T136]
MQSTFDLREAIAEDEEFVLRLEELSLRKLSEMKYGRFVPRPGMGDEFPVNCRIIQYENADVGCLTVSTQGDCIHIDQLYLVPDVHGRGIGRQVIDDLVSQAAKRGQRLQATSMANGGASGFFLAVGFHVVSETSKTITMEWPVQLKSASLAG